MTPNEVRAALAIRWPASRLVAQGLESVEAVFAEWPIPGGEQPDHWRLRLRGKDRNGGWMDYAMLDLDALTWMTAEHFGPYIDMHVLNLAKHTEELEGSGAK